MAINPQIDSDEVRQRFREGVGDEHLVDAGPQHVEASAEDAVGHVEPDLAAGERPERLGQLDEGPAAVADVVHDQEIPVAHVVGMHLGAGDLAGIRAADLLGMNQVQA